MCFQYRVESMLLRLTRSQGFVAVSPTAMQRRLLGRIYTSDFACYIRTITWRSEPTIITKDN